MSAQGLILGYIKAYNAKDVDAMLSFFDDGCVFENISGGNVTVRTEGKAELEALARRSAGAFAMREQRVLSLTEGQGRMVAEVEYDAVLQADLSPDLKAGTFEMNDKVSAADLFRESIAVIDTALPECTCRCRQLTIAHMENSQPAWARHWLQLADEFKQNAMAGLSSLGLKSSGNEKP